MNQHNKPDWKTQIDYELQKSFESIGLPCKLSGAKFWHLQLTVQPDLLDQAVNEIASWPARREINLQDRQLAVVVLLHILHTGLSNVSLGHFWPEIAHRFQGSNGDANKIGNFFRPLLEQFYPRQLKNAEAIHKNRFVFLAVDQAGVGKDRKKIIFEFLRLLIERQIHLTVNEENIESEMKSFVDHFVKTRSQENDVPFFSEILFSTGTTLVNLAHEVFESNDRREMALWSWEQLHTFWFQRSGERLDRLIPEAKDLFLELIGSIGLTISRRELLKLARGTEYEVQTPNQINLESVNYPNEVPLMPVGLNRGPHYRQIQVSDESGLSGPDILRLAPDKWHSIRQHFIYFSKKHFTVSIGDSLEHSVPVFQQVGENLRAEQKGGYWSGSSNFDVLPEINGTGIRPDIAPVFKAHVRWILQANDSLAGKICGFWLRQSGSAERGYITTSTGNSATTKVKNSRSYQTLDPWLHHNVQDVFEPVSAKLELTDGYTLSSSTPFPWLERHFWSLDGRLLDSPNQLLATQTSKISLFVPAGAEVTQSGATIKQPENREGLFDKTHTEYRVQELSADTEISVDGSFVYLGSDRSPRFERQHEKRFEKGGVVLRTIGDMLTFLERSELRLIIPDGLNDNHWMIGTKTFGQREKMFSLKLLSRSGALLRRDGKTIFNLRSHAQSELPDAGDLFEVRLVHQHGHESDKISVFDATGYIECPATTPDEPSALIIRNSITGTHRYESDTTTGELSLDPKCGTTLRTDNETSIALVWKPNLSDVQLVDNLGQEVRSSGDQLINPAGLRLVITGESGKCRFWLNGRRLKSTEIDEASLAELLSETAVHSTGDELVLEAETASKTKKRWKISAIPTLSILEIEPVDGKGVRVIAAWTGVLGGPIKVQLLHNQSLIAEGEILPAWTKLDECGGDLVLGNAALINPPHNIPIDLLCTLSFAGKELETQRIRIEGKKTPELWGQEAEPQLLAFLKAPADRTSADAFYLLTLLNRTFFRNSNASRQFSVSTLRRWAQDNLSHLSERAILHYGIELLVGMAGGHVSKTTKKLGESLSAMSVMVNSAYMINESRKWQYGTANPRILSAGAAYFSTYLAEESPAGYSDWCDDMRLFCEDCASGDAERYIINTNPISKIYLDSLVFDNGFFRWKASVDH